MRFKPVSDEDASAPVFELWPDGVYDFEVNEAKERVSASGNGMIELRLWVFDKSGKRRMVFDYLVDVEGASWKIRHFAEACNMLPQYERGQIEDHECLGRTGRCMIVTQKAQDRYPAKNVIRDYIKLPGATSASGASPAGDDLNDVIPF